jgi:hypothetical protein
VPIARDAAESPNGSTVQLLLRPPKTLTRPRKYDPDLPRVTDCFVIDGGKKVYLDRKLCGN